MSGSLGNTSKKNPAPGKYQSRELKVSIRYALWCLVWAICLTLSNYIIREQLVSEIWFWPVALLPIFLSLWVFYQYYLFYIGVDELARRIQSDGLAIGFGLGIFILIVFVCLSNLGIAQPSANDMLVIFSLSYVVGQLSRMKSYNR